MAEMANVVGGEIVTDEWGNLIRSRTVQRYATVAARTAGHPTPTAGDLSYLQDSGDLDVYHAGAWKHIGPPPGAVQMLAGGSVPQGWLVCNGAAVSRSTYAALFSAIGSVWGAGDGTTTFNLPDLRGRVPRGVANTGDGDAVGERFGSDIHSHPGPIHSHAMSHEHTLVSGGAGGHVLSSTTWNTPGTAASPGSTNTGSSGATSTDINAVFPVAAAAVHFIIKT